MDTKTIVMCVAALLLGMLVANMLKSFSGCNVVEGLEDCRCVPAIDRDSFNTFASASAAPNEQLWNQLKSECARVLNRHSPETNVSYQFDDYTSKDACKYEVTSLGDQGEHSFLPADKQNCSYITSQASINADPTLEGKCERM